MENTKNTAQKKKFTAILRKIGVFFKTNIIFTVILIFAIVSCFFCANRQGIFRLF